MFPISRPFAKKRQASPLRALALLPLLTTLASAHPGGQDHRNPFAPRACLEAAGLDFGSVKVGAKAEGSLSIRNRCPHGLTLYKAVSGNKAFTVSLAKAVQVPARGGISLPVSFAPADTGSKKALLSLYARHPDERLFAWVSGRGTAPTPPPPPGLTVSPTSVHLAMGPAETDTFSLSVTNHGTSPRAEILVDAIGDATPRPERGWRVMYLNTAMPSTWDDNLMTLLRPLANVDTLESWYGGDSLPSLSRMLEYDIVMVNSVAAWKDPVATGDLLADFLEAGGKVLLMAGALASDSHNLFGRISYYLPTGPAATTFSRNSVSLANHPITAGVGAFHAGGIINVTTTNGQGAGIPLGTYEDGILIGAYHPDKPLVFLNIGDYELSGDIARLAGNAFDYLGGMAAWMTPRPPFDPVIFVVPDGETRELKVAVNTHRLAAGNHAGAIRLWNVSDTDAVPMDVPVSLDVSSRRRLAVDPAMVDFGPTWQGGSAKRAVRLVNRGNTSTHVTGFVSGNPAFSLSAAFPLDIPAFSYAYVQAAFAPSALGPDSATIVAQGDAQESGPVGISVKGKGIVPPIVSVSPRGFAVTLTEGQQVEQTLSIRNPGGDSLKLALRAEVDSAAGVHPTGPVKMKVLYLQTTGQTFESETDFFLWNLLTDPRIDSVVSYAGYDSTPTLEYMRQFDAVIAVAEGAWADSETVGNLLADYVDVGGKVILMGAVLYNGPTANEHSPALGGRIVSPDYSPVGSAEGILYNYSPQFADDPITEGLTDFLNSTWALNVTTTQGGGIPLGTYTSTGALIGAYNPRKPVVFVNIVPHDGDHDHFQTVRFLGNSLQHLSEFYNWLRPAQRTLALGPGEEIDLPIRFGASYGPVAGSYSGRLNLFHNDPATGSPLVVPATLTVEPGAATAAARP
jgi:hypothetical protein